MSRWLPAIEWWRPRAIRTLAHFIMWEMDGLQRVQCAQLIASLASQKPANKNAHAQCTGGNCHH
jgi:hypothetical protein